MTQADRATASPSTAWKEVVEADEQTLFEGFAREITARQKEVAAETGGPLRRGFHAKLHAGLTAEFEVLADLPEYARYGVFSAPRIFPAVVRFSNGEPAHLKHIYKPGLGLNDISVLSKSCNGGSFGRDKSVIGESRFWASDCLEDGRS